MNTVLTERLPEIERAWQALREDRYDQAMHYAQQAMKKLPDDPDVVHILGVLASRDGRQDIALPLLQKAIDKGGATERRLRDIAKALLQAGHPQAALTPLEDAIRQFGENAELLGLRAAIEAALERWEDAARSAHTAIAVAPHLMAWEGTLAFCELIRQNWSTGFRAWSGRAENLPAGSRCPALRPDTPGELWIRNEQGPGDALFFLRFAAPLAAQGWKLHVQSDRKTLPLLQSTELFASVEERCKCPVDGFWLNAGELPLAAQQISAEAVQSSLPLQPDPRRVEKMRAELAALGPAPYIAVSWRGGVRGRKERRGTRMLDKYIDPAALGAALAPCAGTIISIQRLPDADEFIAFSRALGRRVADYSALNNNLPGMLALLEVVDEYIAVPNTNVHLREALGKHSQVLVNQPWQDWRWLDAGDKSPWYPHARIHRQAKDGSWQHALENAARELPRSPTTIAIDMPQEIDEASIRQNMQTRILDEGWEALKAANIAAAIFSAQQVLAQTPEHAGALHLLGWAALKDFKFDLAESVLEKAAALAPNDGLVQGDYIRALAATQRYEAALAEVDRALNNPQLKGKSAIYYGQAAVHLQQGSHEAALAAYAACLGTSPNHLNALAYGGMVRLRLGDARRGFREYSARREARKIEGHVCPWLRGNLQGLKLLVRREMGLGDELTYLRYLPWLTRAGVEVTYWAGAKLAPILQRLSYASTVLADNTPYPDQAGFDLAIEVNEIPVAAEALDAPEIAPPLPLSPRPELIEKWRSWLNTLGPGPYIGLNWRAGVASKETSISFNRLAKAIDPSLLARMLAPVQATWVSLQRNITLDELDEFRDQLDAEVHDAAGLTDDLEDLLALQSLLDENVGVSNTNMHLRAGLGLSSRVLVQNPGSDWRWGHEGSTSCWFTDSKVYRQQAGEDWTSALEALQHDLLQRHGTRTANATGMPSLAVALAHSSAIAKKTAQHRCIWVTAGNIKNDSNGRTSNLASTRYRVLMPAVELEKQGWHCEIVNENLSRAWGGWKSAAPQQGDTVVISKIFTDHALKLASDAKARGASLVVDICDNLLEHPKRGPLQQALLGMADNIICSTEALADAIKPYGKTATAIISDPVEMTRGEIRFQPGKTLRLLWFGHAVNLDTLVQFLPALARYGQQQPLRLDVVTQLPEGESALARLVPDGLDAHYIPWSVEATQQALQDCDIVVIPTLATDSKLAKSPNRLLEALWAGRFVVCGPLPAYLPFADSVWVSDNLTEGLQWALSHPLQVEKRIAQGQVDIEQYFCRRAIGEQWHQVLRSRGGMPVVPAPMPENMPVIKRLNLGCGDKILPGYINVDVVPSRGGKQPDVLCDLHQLTPFADNSIDEILSVHVIEHFWRWEVLDIIREWMRVLKPGGRMILECPNLQSACEAFLKNPEAAASGGPEGQRSMWVFYGDPRWQDPYMVHRWGYTPQSLSRLLTEAGLVNARQEPAQFKLREPRDMRIVAEKPEDGLRQPANQNQSQLPDINGEIDMQTKMQPTSVSQLPGNKSIEEHLWDGYLTWFYHTNVWKQMTWHGIRTLKLPSDMWNYQEIIHERKVDWVIEAGTRHGGSALFFAEALAARQARGKVISMDVDPDARQIKSHDGIEFLIGDSGSQQIVDQVAAMLPAKRGPVFLILDSDHSCAHVLREMEVWVPFLQAGDYLVVEDSAINGHPLRPDFGPGPYEAVAQFMAQHQGLLSHDAKRERKFGATQAPMGYFIKN